MASDNHPTIWDSWNRPPVPRHLSHSRKGGLNGVRTTGGFWTVHRGYWTIQMIRNHSHMGNNRIGRRGNRGA
ncbi:hypothetical protein PGT21_000863 [Puccinia graminis f. sp. tritici]|uniref:Uncharacterized protein n=1 Tax=Puccinia graminis f. sp. tritici TaxID=56615 RepID=A0A5B0MND6_PUCGR|nr:hypothetical protein PGT21_022594 [Puccinia graminis f. sp. tritici]KAA1110817.1 hypothetical protein PGT21_032324 [Puccinia graminis f. sp. tritici]KAA1115831.1 hypothetical protein PGT21_000844 [Puccinia graminis f. sp. tritici]KAA1115832.1 hypothetical protein PGT21_000863 [Puccinia graminis f. sp. tritici]